MKRFTSDSDFLNRFPESWTPLAKHGFGIEIWKQNPKERELGRHVVVTEQLDERFGKEKVNRELGPLIAWMRHPEAYKINHIVYKSTFLQLLEQEHPGEEAMQLLIQFEEWFRKLMDEAPEELDQELQNDILFGMARMFMAQVSWSAKQIETPQQAKLKKRGNWNNDNRFAEILKRRKDEMPMDDSEPWRQKWLDDFERLIFKFEIDSEITKHKSMTKMQKAFYGQLAGKVPFINIEISCYLKNDLGQKLKGKRERPEPEHKRTNNSRISNDKRAAELLIEGAGIFGIQLPHIDRLRKKIVQ